MWLHSALRGGESRSGMLNDAKIRAAKAQAKPYKLTDAHRLHFLITPKGAKLWRWGYSYDSEQKTLCIGPYPLVSLLKARDRRDEGRRLLAEDRDAAVAKKLKIDTSLEASRNTFESVARDWHETKKAQWAKGVRRAPS